MIVITGASGHLGRLVVADLLRRGVPADQVVAAVRTPAKAADLAAQGVVVREADYDRPETLAPALAGAEKVLLVSGSAVGKRVEGHRNVIEAARAAGVGLLGYTSAPMADTTTMLLAADHRATEELVRSSGLSYVLLRNGWYLENYTGDLGRVLESGSIVGSSGTGRVSAAARADYAAAAAAVLTGDGHEKAVYELGGDTAFDKDELAAEITAQSGTAVAYRDLPVAEYAGILAGPGLPAGIAEIIADSDHAIARGELLVESGDLGRLIGRPTTPLSDGVAAALAGLRR